MIKRFVYLLIFVLLFNACKQKNPPVISSQSFYLFKDSSLQINASEALKSLHDGKFVKASDQYINFGFTKSVYWLAFQTGQLPAGDSTFLNVGDSHINELEFYLVDHTPNLLFTTGDYYPFSHRPLMATGYYFPLKSNRQYLVKINKHHESLQLSFSFKPLSAIVQQEKSDTAFIALCTGMIVLLIIFGMFLFIISRSSIYLIYIAYIAAGWLYVLANTGFAFQYLWPNDCWFASKSRHVASLLSVVFSIAFMEVYIGGIKHKISRLVLNITSILLLIVVIISLLGSYKMNTTNWWMYFQYIVPIISFLYILFAFFLLISHSVRGNKLAQFYLFASSTLLCMVVVQLVYYSGNWNIHQTFYSKFGIAIAYVVEVIIITAGLVYRFNQYRLEKEKLLVEINQQQVENTRILMDVQEAERSQIANQLHDVAGSLLSAARLNLSSLRERGIGRHTTASVTLQKAEEAISMVSETVRNLSHALSPIMLEKAGFKTALQKIVAIFNASGKLTIELIVVGFDEVQVTQHALHTGLYSIIYELLNNVVKHAHARHCLVQVIEHEHCCTLIVEDDGIGLSNQGSVACHGLTGIRSKVAYYNGDIAMDNNEPKGLIITIEIPKTNDVQTRASR